MVQIRHRGRPNERPLDVPKDAVKSWGELGYEPVEDAPAPKRAASTRTRKTSAKSDSK